MNEAKVHGQFTTFNFSATKPCLADISNSVDPIILVHGGLMTWKKLAPGDGPNSNCSNLDGQEGRQPKLDFSEVSMSKKRCVSVVVFDDKENFQVVAGS